MLYLFWIHFSSLNMLLHFWGWPLNLTIDNCSRVYDQQLSLEAQMSGIVGVHHIGCML